MVLVLVSYRVTCSMKSVDHSTPFGNDGGQSSIGGSSLPCYLRIALIAAPFSNISKPTQLALTFPVSSQCARSCCYGSYARVDDSTTTTSTRCLSLLSSRR